MSTGAEKEFGPPATPPAGETQPGANTTRRRDALAACGRLERSFCNRNLSAKLNGFRSDKTALTRILRQHCAIFQCLQERGLSCCSQCLEAPCVFHSHLDRICPAREEAGPTQPWRLLPLRRAGDPWPDEATPRKKRIPERCIPRLRSYLAALDHLRQAGLRIASSQEIAAKVGVLPSLVRKDLCRFGRFGTPSRGYQIDGLRRKITSVLGLQQTRRVAWIGAERLSALSWALAQFGRHNWQVVAVFDSEPTRVGTLVGSFQVLNLGSLEQVSRNLDIKAAVLAVGEREAQAVAGQLARAGIEAVLNLTAVPLSLPAGMAVQQADLATQLALLSYHTARPDDRMGK